MFLMITDFSTCHLNPSISTVDVSVLECQQGAEGAAPEETSVEVISLQSPSCHFLFAYLKASCVPLRARNICSKTVPYFKGVTRRRWCGHNRLSHISSTFHPIIQGGRLAWASYLREKWRSLSSRGISFQSNVQHLKPTDTSSPFLSPFSRHVLVLFIINSAITPIWLRDYPSCSCWNLSLTCTLEHSHTHAHIS